MNNKKIGNATEKKLCELLQQKGFWVHLMAYNSNGQPCDVIALKNNWPLLLDVKHCSGKRFEVKNIQPNQIEVFKYLKQSNNIGTTCGFAIYSEVHQDWFWLNAEKVIYGKAKSYDLLDLKRFKDVYEMYN